MSFRKIAAEQWLRVLMSVALTGVWSTEAWATDGAEAATKEAPAKVDPITTVELPVNGGPTALDRYIAAKDDSYAWKLISKEETPLGTLYTIELTSQTWLRPDEVDRPVWKHWLMVAKPKGVTSNKALMFISGGKNGNEPPKGLDGRMVKIAVATKSVVAELKQVPNQPLVFHNDGQPRSEDDLIAYTWDHYLKTGDERWPARLPMVKSVVRAMDTVQALMAGEEGGKLNVNQFVVAGGSKRGWTTWMTAAVDKRVVAIMPIVIDVLNLDISMRNHFAAYGFWAPAVDDYVNHKIMHRRNTDRYIELMRIEDPYAYRDRFTMPKCIINASGDQFFCPDSSQYYFGDLPGEKNLCYVPNADHSLDGSNALDTMVAFHYCIVNDVARPKFDWAFAGDKTIRVRCETKPKKVMLWHAHNDKNRDFRVEEVGKIYQNEEVKDKGDGVYDVDLSVPASGWTAYFVQCEFEVGAPTTLRYSTGIKILPDEFPHIEKPIPLLDE